MKTVINTVQMFLLEVLEGWKIHFYWILLNNFWFKLVKKPTQDIINLLLIAYCWIVFVNNLFVPSPQTTRLWHQPSSETCLQIQQVIHSTNQLIQQSNNFHLRVLIHRKTLATPKLSRVDHVLSHLNNPYENYVK